MSSPSGFVRHFIACNRFDPSQFAPFYIAGHTFGAVSRDLADSLVHETDLFEPSAAGGIALSPSLNRFDQRSDALMEVTRWIAARRDKKLRDEMYPLIAKWGDRPVAQIDRAAVPWFGARAWGIHVNGFVRKNDGLYLWIGERAADRPADPGKLDNMIGGGQPIGLTLEQNLCKEAQEEAGIAPALALTARQVQVIDYRLQRTDGMRRDTLFIYDLELPESFTPRNTDGEVASFHLMPVAEVASVVASSDAFKFNCNLVIIDFLIRHGVIPADHPEFNSLTEWLKKDFE